MHDKSLITTDIDYDRKGKQFGVLRVPQSTNSAGWANTFIPLVVVANGQGPTSVLIGGNHGDEFEGPVTLMKLARTLQPQQIQGRVVILPMLNRPALAAGTRLSPIDGANMNRSFPGRRDATITGMIAHYVSQSILPLADLVLDIHSGGSSMHMLPCVNMHRLENNQAQFGRMLSAARAWGAPYVLIYRDVAGEGLLPSLAEQMGKTTLGTEMGSRAQFGVETLRITEQGVDNVLHWAGILSQRRFEPPGSPPQIIEADDPRDYIMAPRSGIFEPACEMGDTVQAGDVVGQIHSVEKLDQPPEPVRAETDGLVFSRRAIPLTIQGECVTALARRVDSL